MKPTVSTAIFEADADGFRAQNADRPPEHLVRELVQNALDTEGVTALDVAVTYHGPRRGTTVVVTDNSPQGVTDPKLLFTIWLSDKQDSPQKRGRMGRGLKELISVADETIIRSASCDALVFTRYQGGRWERRTAPKLGRPERGTEVRAFCRAWGDKAARGIVAFLRRIRPPASLTMRVGYVDASQGATEVPLEPIGAFVSTETYIMTLPTTMFEVVDGERAERERIRSCTVTCFTPPPGEDAYVYEMGIPVEACESPVSIDVGQRVILRERRDTLTESYKRKLFAQVLSRRIEKGLVSNDQLRDNAAVIAAASPYDLSDTAAQYIAKVWTEGKPFAADPKTRAMATGHHVEVINLRSLPESIRDIVRMHGTNVKEVLEARRDEFCPVMSLEALTDAHRRLATFWEWCAKGIGRPCTVAVRAGNPAAADFNRATRTLSVYVGGVDKNFFETPAGARQLSLLTHELSHWEPKEDEHGSDFSHDNDDVGGALAAFLLNGAEQARLILAGK